MKNRLRRFAFASLSLLVLFGSFNLLENWRGRRGWIRWIGSRPATTESFERYLQFPLDLSDEDNFAKAPSIANSVAIDSPKSLLGSLHIPKLFQEINCTEDLEIQLQKQNKTIKLKNLPAIIKPFNHTLDEISLAAKRPACRMPNRVVKWNFSSLPGFLEVGKLYMIRARLRLRLGQADAAFEDVLTCIAIANHLRAEPGYVGYLIRQALVRDATCPIKEALAMHCWSERQLALIEQELVKIDLLESWRSAILIEQLLIDEYFSTLLQETFLDRNRHFLYFEGTEKNNHTFLNKEPLARARVLLSSLGKNSNIKTNYKQSLGHVLIPKGWIYKNWEQTNLDIESYLITPVDRQRHRVDSNSVKNLGIWVSTRMTPYRTWTTNLVAYPMLAKEIERLALQQANLDQAIVACALERHRLGKGDYPQNLNDLVPAFLPKLPPDVITGESLHYERTSGGFLLSSFGWNKDNKPAWSVPLSLRPKLKNS